MVLIKESSLAIVTLRGTVGNAHKENKRAKVIAHLGCSLLLLFKVSLGFGFDFEFGLELS